MRPPACTQCRWGTGTTKEKINTGASKELEAKLAQLHLARETMDTAWFAPPSSSTYTSAVQTHPSQASSSGTSQYAPSSQQKATGNP